MLASVFTPTHDHRFLQEAYDCLKSQTHKNWEWVVVPNGSNQQRIERYVRAMVNGDLRVKIHRFPSGFAQGHIGALKLFACDKCSGDLFIEFDHDDLITNTCLESIVAAAKLSSPNAFIYSDDVTLNPDGKTSRKYSVDYGWRHYDWKHKGVDYLVNSRPEISPRSLCEILYAPDHVRAWTREAYRKSGGHNPDLKYGDDHELMVRTYLEGTQFVHIDRPLYIHRLRNDNTCVPNGKEIQQQSRATRDRYLADLVAEWCRREDLPMYDLGGAHNCPDGYTPIDPHLPEDVPGLRDDVWNIDFPANSVGCFRAQDFLEHVHSKDIPELMNKLYDALVPGGWILSNTPAAADNEGRFGRGSVQDPTHVSSWTSNNFWYYSDSRYARFVPEIRCRFQAVVLANYYPSTWHREHLIPYVRADLCAIKEIGPRMPGLIKI